MHKMISFWESKVQTSPELLATIKEILECGKLSLRAGGPHVRELEARIRHLTGRRYAIAVSSATAGLMLFFSHPMFKGREVLLPAFTFAATMTAAQWNNMRLVFCDVHPDTWTLDPDDVMAKLSDDTAAIVPVNMFGNPPDYARLMSISRCCDVPLLVDDAQSMGSIYRGKPAGAYGHAAVFSFSPSKVLTGGEGGVIVTDDKGIYEHCLRGRHFGDDGSYNPTFPGLNAKLTELQAAVILHQLPGLSEKVQRARARVQLYRLHLSDTVKYQRENGRSAWKELTILVPPDARGRISEALSEAGVDHRTYWHRPLHKTGAYLSYSQHGVLPRLPVTESLADRVLSLPMHDGLAPDGSDIEYISAIINKHMAKRST